MRLLHRLASDPVLPRGARLLPGALILYLALPDDLIPDFIPLVGYADDVVLVALVLRWVVRRAGPEAIERHWPGAPEGLAAVIAFANFGSAERFPTNPASPHDSDQTAQLESDHSEPV